MLEQVEIKLKQVLSDLEKSMANHNFLLGFKAALENTLADLKTAAPVVEAVVDVVAPADATIVNEAVSAVENVI